jgi:hypothetical protein
VRLHAEDAGASVRERSKLRVRVGRVPRDDRLRFVHDARNVRRWRRAEPLRVHAEDAGASVRERSELRHGA